MVNVTNIFAYSITGITAGLVAVSLSDPRRRRLFLRLLFNSPPTKRQRSRKVSNEDTSLLHLATSDSEYDSDEPDEDNSFPVGSPAGYYADESQNLLALLYSIAEDQSKKGN
jgi:hypothetical protein